MMRRNRNYNSVDLAAANWIIRLEDIERPTTAREQIDFFDWLKRSPDHVKAFLQVADVSRAFDGFDAQRRIDLERFLAGNRSTVRPIGISPAGQPPLSPKPALTRHWRPFAIAASVVLTATAIVFGVRISGADRYRTAVGEQRIVKLADGSVLQLNTRSRAAVRFTAAERSVSLTEGEALFTVERDPTRPFYVYTSSATVRAVGTQFNVRENAGATTVSVVEGVVQVTSTAHSRTDGLLKAGEQAHVAAGKVVRRSAAHAPDTLAWRDRRLVFDETALGDVVAEFNRYNKMQLRVEGVLSTEKHLTAIFNADHPESLIHYLQQDGSVSVVREADNYTIRAKDQ